MQDCSRILSKKKVSIGAPAMGWWNQSLTWTKVPQSNFILMVKFKFGRMFVSGFFQFLFYMQQRNCIFLVIVCCTESLRPTTFLFVALSHCDTQNHYMLQNMCGKKNNKVPKQAKVWQHIQIKFVAVTQSDKYLFFVVAVIQ